MCFIFDLCSDAENEDCDNDEDEDEENDENMDTSESHEPRPRNPDDEFNFADYDNEGLLMIFECIFVRFSSNCFLWFLYQTKHKWQP